VIELLARPGQEPLLANVLRTSNRKVRREIFRGVLQLPGNQIGRVVEFGLTAGDAVVRLWFAKRVRSYFSGESLCAVLQQIKSDRSMPVRREAMLIEAEDFPESAETVWKRALLDSNSSLRELAHIHFIRLSRCSPAQVYRHALIETPTSLAAILGVGETGDQADLPLIRTYLNAAIPSHRRAAVRGLARIGGEAVVAELTECLRDDSPSVVREVQKQLERWPYFLDEGRILAIVSDARQKHVRKTGMRLLFEKGKWDGMPWLIPATRHCCAESAQLAQALIEKWFSPPLCNKIFTKPSSSQMVAISEATMQSAENMPAAFRDKLERWIAEI
jgi:hypothetical protein